MAVFTKRSSGRWQARVRRLGWPEQSKTFRTISDAEAWARATEREMDIGAFINRDDAERTTFSSAADRYRREILPSKRGRAQDEYVVKRVVEHFGSYSLASITGAMLSAYRDERLKAVAPQTVVHELGMMSRIFKAASMDWGIALPQGNPTALVRKPRLSTGRTRRLEAGEEDLLLAALSECKSPWPRAAVILATETAARQSELISLTWDAVDLVRRVARIKGKDGGITKSGDSHRDVPLTSRAVALLEALPRSIGGKVLPITQNALQLSWERSLARARTGYLHKLLVQQLEAEGIDGASEVRALTYKKRTPTLRTFELLTALEKKHRTLVDLHFHDLRHEATSRLAEKLQMHELMKVTGHKSSSMLSRYYHPRAEDLASKLA